MKCKYFVAMAICSLIMHLASISTQAQLSRPYLQADFGGDFARGVASINRSINTTGGLRGVVAAPTTPVVTDDGAYTSSATQLRATWTSSDPAGIVEYQYRIRRGSTSGTIIVAWTSTGTTTSVTRTSLSLLQGTTYYFQVRSRNSPNQWSSVGSSDGIKVDTTAPAAVPSVTDDGVTTNSTTQLRASWGAATDAESGVTEYQYLIRQDSTGGTIIVNWTSTGTTTTVTRTGLTLTVGTRYYFGVRARNGAGTLSSIRYSDGILVQATAIMQVQVESRGVHAQEYVYQQGVARFWKDGTLFYAKTGGGGGGRGFNVAVLDQSSGAFIDQGSNFDTWATRSTGAAMTALVNYLNSIPAGRVILISVADEASLNTDLSCNRLPFAWVETGLQTLEGLGATQIRSYCFQDSWALIAVKGQGRLAEMMTHTTDPALISATIALSGGTTDTTPPTAPGQPAENVPDQDTDQDGAYMVNWLAATDAESGVTSYELQERIGTSGAWTTLSSAVVGTTFNVTGRLNATTYYYQVRARNGIGLTGAWSPVSDGVQVDTQPPQVSAIGVSGVTQTSASLNWSVNEPASCTVLCGTNPSPTASCSTTGLGPFHTVTLNSLTPATTYYASVTCNDTAGHTSAPSTTSFATSSAAAPTQPSVVTINGRQLLLQRRNSNGTLAPAVPYVIRGVNWSPAGVSTATSSGDANNAEIRRLEFGQWYLTDIPLLKAMNVNTVRLFMDLGLPGDPNLTVPGLTILDEFYRNGIMVIMTVDNGNNTVSRIQSVVDHYKNHPAVLLWSLGSEWSINLYFGAASSALDAAQRTQNAAALVKTRDTVHPVVSSYGTIFNKPNDIETYVNQTCPSVDIWSFNEYRGPGFSQIFEQWRYISGKPMFLGEYGIDAYNSTTQQEDQATHAQWGGWLWDEIARNLSANDPNNVAIGGAIFEWNDEWWKSGSWQTQDPGGWNPIAFPDGVASEDWWGIVNINRNTRQLYGAMTTRFGAGYQPPARTKTVTYRAVSHVGFGAIARFWENGAVMYQGTAAIGVGPDLSGARGFNIAAIDPATGRLRNGIQRFDTWATRNNGADMNAMVAYLDSLPNGTIVLIAVGDEAGLNSFPPSGCTSLPYSWVTAARQRLQSLGSTQIQNYCYQNQWAMIAIKGQGVLSESLSSTGDAPVQATVQLP